MDRNLLRHNSWSLPVDLEGFLYLQNWSSGMQEGGCDVLRYRAAPGLTFWTAWCAILVKDHCKSLQLCRGKKTEFVSGHSPFSLVGVFHFWGNSKTSVWLWSPLAQVISTGWIYRHSNKPTFFKTHGMDMGNEECGPSWIFNPHYPAASCMHIYIYLYAYNPYVKDAYTNVP